MIGNITIRIVGVGLYTPTEASLLTGVSIGRIRRWLAGYRYATRKGQRKQKPLWPSDLPSINGTLMLSFNDLMEIRAVRQFLEAGLSLQKMRRAFDELRKVSGFRYPFSREAVVTDGVELFRKTVVDGTTSLYELSRARNYAFPEVILANLKKGVVFDREILVRWRPDPDLSSAIVVDPAVAQGQPIVQGTRIPANVLSRALRVEGDLKRVGEWYNVDPAIVQQAVEFENRYPV
jgi:uncharacterized protein (DUF433 family)